MEIETFLFHELPLLILFRLSTFTSLWISERNHSLELLWSLLVMSCWWEIYHKLDELWMSCWNFSHIRFAGGCLMKQPCVLSPGTVQQNSTGQHHESVLRSSLLCFAKQNGFALVEKKSTSMGNVKFYYKLVVFISLKYQTFPKGVSILRSVGIGILIVVFAGIKTEESSINLKVRMESLNREYIKSDSLENTSKVKNSVARCCKGRFSELPYNNKGNKKPANFSLKRLIWNIVSNVKKKWMCLSYLVVPKYKFLDWAYLYSTCVLRYSGLIKRIHVMYTLVQQSNFPQSNNWELLFAL